MTKKYKSRKASFWDFGLLKGCACAMKQASSDETAKARILIVEDEEKIARFVELELLHEGYLVEKAFDGRNGLDLALNGHFDLLLLDVLLPGLNGFELLRRLRKTSSLPVIMLTAKDGVMDTVAGLDMGADDYMTKPFSIEELLARIRLVLRKSQKIRIRKNSTMGRCIWILPGIASASSLTRSQRRATLSRRLNSAAASSTCSVCLWKMQNFY